MDGKYTLCNPNRNRVKDGTATEEQHLEIGIHFDRKGAIGLEISFLTEERSLLLHIHSIVVRIIKFCVVHSSPAPSL